MTLLNNSSRCVPATTLKGFERMKRILQLSLALVLLSSLSAFAQQNLTLVVTGQSGQIPIVQMNGKSYVDIDALAGLTNSSVSIKGNQVILTPLGSAPSKLAADHERSAPTGQLKLVAARQPVDPEPSEPAAQAKPATAEPAPDAAASEAERTAALAKAAQNPVANMISVPIQNNTNFGIGPYSRDQDVLNFQPVIPLHISKNWNLITRTILPVIWQPNSSQP